VTKPVKAVLDLCREKTISRDFIAQAVTEGINRDLISRREKEKPLIPMFFQTGFPDFFVNLIERKYKTAAAFREALKTRSIRTNISLSCEKHTSLAAGKRLLHRSTLPFIFAGARHSSLVSSTRDYD